MDKLTGIPTGYGVNMNQMNQVPQGQVQQTQQTQQTQQFMNGQPMNNGYVQPQNQFQQAQQVQSQQMYSQQQPQYNNSMNGQNLQQIGNVESKQEQVNEPAKTFGKKLGEITRKAQANLNIKKFYEVLENAAKDGNSKVRIPDLREYLNDKIMDGTIWDWLKSQDLYANGQVDSSTGKYDFIIYWEA